MDLLHQWRPTTPNFTELRLAATCTVHRLPGVRQLLQLACFSSLLSSFHRVDPGTSVCSSCPNAELSCHNASVVADTCCFNHPGGQFLQTQFWDTNPPRGPRDSWTIHGLWPDHCDGGFDQYCDDTRYYGNISSIIAAFDDPGLLDYMRVFWQANLGPSESLWAHEWNKHGTCISTLATKCYSPYLPQREVLDYFNITVVLFQQLDTYRALEAAGITPNHDKTWDRAELQAPLQRMHSMPVTLRCHEGRLNEVWYHFVVRGSLQTGEFIPSAPDGAKSNCPARGIRYVPKDDGPTSTTTASSTTTVSASATATLPPFVGRGHLLVRPVHNSTRLPPHRNSCLLRSGKWYTSGSCATYRPQLDVVGPPIAVEAQHVRQGSSEGRTGAVSSDHVFTLTTSLGPCALEALDRDRSLDSQLDSSDSGPRSGSEPESDSEDSGRSRTGPHISTPHDHEGQQLLSAEHGGQDAVAVEDDSDSHANNAFTCHRNLRAQTIFSAVGNKLAYRGRTDGWCATKVPGRFEKVDIYNLHFVKPPSSSLPPHPHPHPHLHHLASHHDELAMTTTDSLGEDEHGRRRGDIKSDDEFSAVSNCEVPVEIEWISL